MIYVEKSAEAARVSGIAANRGAVQTFVQRLVMQTIFDVLESQARAAFLPDPVISTILDQLTVNITYEPLKCQAVALKLDEKGESLIINVYIPYPERNITGITKAELC
ncbi:hypothetical protein KIN20_020547 [Parelaphostrongylus tenuis]|uniref:Uncharacterized protein n=1 Tax=Parelaphostrongylus tenuis TaxID=148309 RepID=A0AAD5QTK6_PARTN|nr:hypothetical protein KIN20_020547 [Parelaphostrongylus tenuis]